MQIASQIIEGKRLMVPNRSDLPGDLFGGLDRYIGLMQKCWAHQPLDRPSFAQIIGELRWVSSKRLVMLMM